jgi:hypothetical protein
MSVDVLEFDNTIYISLPAINSGLPWFRYGSIDIERECEKKSVNRGTE